MFNPDGEKISREPQWKKSAELQRDEATLKKIASRNFERNISKERKPRPDLVDNFHWVIMRVRRMRKLTQEQFAREISEPLAAIKLAEEGILPEKDYVLVKKIESFLGITLIKEEIAKKPETIPAKKLAFEPDAAKRITIADLRRIREESSSMRGRVKERKEFSTPIEVDDDSEEPDLEDKER